MKTKVKCDSKFIVLAKMKVVTLIDTNNDPTFGDENDLTNRDEINCTLQRKTNKHHFG